MAEDISTLVLKVTSDGITESTKKLNDLAAASEKAEGAAKKLGTAAVTQASSDKKATDAIEKLLDRMAKQVDLLGANTAAKNAYTMAMAKGTEAQIRDAQALGAQVDAYKAEQEALKKTSEVILQANAARAQQAVEVNKAHAQALKMNEALDASTGKFHVNTGAVRESMVLLHEASQGSWKRFGGSLIVLGERVDALPKLFQAAGNAAMSLGVSVGVFLGTIVAVVGALGAAGYTFLSSQSQLKDLRNEVVLTGGAIGATGDKLYEMADAAGATTGNIAKARSLFVELGNTGKFSAEQISTITKTALELEHVTGTSVETVIKQFTKLAAEPLGNTERSYRNVSKSAMELDASMHFLSPSILAQIQAFENMGESSKASALAIETYANVLKERTEEAEKNLTDFGKTVSHIFVEIKDGWTHLFEKDSNLKQLQDLQKQLDEMDKRAAKQKSTGGLFIEKDESQARIKLAADVAAAQQKVNEDQDKQDKKFAQQKLDRAANMELENRRALDERTKGETLYQEKLRKFDQGTATLRLALQDKVAKGEDTKALESLLTEQHLAEEKDKIKELYDKKDKKQRGTDTSVQDRRGAIEELKQSQAEMENYFKEGLALSKAAGDADHTQLRVQLDDREKYYDEWVASLKSTYNKVYAEYEKFKKLPGITPEQRASASADQKALGTQLTKDTGGVEKLRRNDEKSVTKTEVEDQEKLLKAIDTTGEAENKRLQAELKGVNAKMEAVSQLKSVQSDYQSSVAAEEAEQQDLRNKELEDIAALGDGQREAAERELVLGNRRLLLLKAISNAYAETAKRQRVQEEQDRTTKNIDEALAAAKRFGKGMADAFGESGKAIGGVAEAFAQFAKDRDTAQVNFNKASKEDKESGEALAAQQRANGEAQVTAYANIAESAKGFFSEGSKGYAAMSAASKVFHVAEAAMQAARIIQLGIAAILTQGSGDPYTAFARIAAMTAIVAGLGVSLSGGGSGGQTSAQTQKTQGTGSVLGDSDAKSESITKLLESIKDTSNMTLPLTSQMAASLKNIENSIAGVASLVARTVGVQGGTNLGVQEGTLKTSGFNTLMSTLLGTNSTGGAIGGAGIGFILGGPLGAALGTALGGVLGNIAGKITSLWGKTTQKIVDSGIQFSGMVSDLQKGNGYQQYANVDTTKSSWFGLSKSTSSSVVTQGLSDELSNQFGLIFKGLEDTLKIAAPSLGKDADQVAKAIETFALPLTQISLKDLKGDDLTNAINTVISKALDDIAKAAFPEMQAFQQVGEGYSETVIRVASGIEQASVALAEFNIKAISYTDIIDKQADVTLSIVQQSIALKEGASGVENIIKSITSSADDVITAYRALIELRTQMQSFGLGISLSIDTITGAGGLDKLQKGLETFSTKFRTVGEQLGTEASSVTSSFAAIGMKLPESRDQLRSWIEAAAQVGDQKQLGQLLALTTMYDQLVTDAEKFGSGVAAAIGKDAAAAVALAKSLTVVSDSFDTLTSVVNDQKAAIEDTYNAVSAVMKTQHESILKNINDNKSAMDQQQAAQIAIATGRMEAAKMSILAEKATTDATIQTTKDRVSAINTILGSLTSAIADTATTSAVDLYKNALSTVQQAGKSSDISSVTGLDDAIKTLQKPLTDSYSTFLDFQTAQAVANDALKTLQDNGTTQLSDAQKQLDALTDLSNQLEVQANAIDDQIKSFQENVKLASDVAIDAENARYEAAQAALDTKHSEDIAALDAILKNAQDQVDILTKSYTATLDLNNALARFTSAITTATAASAPVAAANNVTAKDPNTAFVESLYSSILGRTGEAQGLDYWTKKLAAGESKEGVISGFINSAEYAKLHPSFDVGTNEVAEDMLANIHKGERIMPAADNAELMRRLDKNDDASSDSSVATKLDELIDVIMRGDVANVSKSNEIYRLVRDWDANGLPPVRPST